MRARDHHRVLKLGAVFWETSSARQLPQFLPTWVESIGATILKRRVSTRAVLASKDGRDLLNENAIAFAVYRPIRVKTATLGTIWKIQPNFRSVLAAQ